MENTKKERNDKDKKLIQESRERVKTRERIKDAFVRHFLERPDLNVFCPICGNRGHENFTVKDFKEGDTFMGVSCKQDYVKLITCNLCFFSRLFDMELFVKHMTEVVDLNPESASSTAIIEPELIEDDEDDK